MDLREINWRYRVDSFGSGYGLVARSFEYGDGPAGSGATE
jgi:hypothetical protein